MEFDDPVYCLEVWGDYACFTRPEMKVERVSYDVITPSAARMIFQAVFWKPAIKWQIEKIEVLNPIRWISIRRNETAKLCSPSGECVLIEKDRQQKAGLLLRDVRYRIHARQIYLPPDKRPNTQNRFNENFYDEEERVLQRKDENPGKYHAIFERRARKGQCIMQPYLGCREFSCNFRPILQGEQQLPTINETRDLGFMLYDMDYSDESSIMPMFYRPQLVSGVITVPPPESEEVFR